MKFYHNGTKKSNEPGIAGGCLLLIGFGAIIFLLFQLKDMEDVKEYGWQIILAIVMGVSLFSMFFAKKAKLSNRHIIIENDYLKIEKVGVPLKNTVLDIYKKGNEFKRYHLRDTDGKIAIYSALEDDLKTYFEEELQDQVQYYKEHSSKHDGPYVSVAAEHQSLFYNLDSGKYTITLEDETEISFLPEVFTYDGKYKKGTPLLKKKS